MPARFSPRFWRLFASIIALFILLSLLVIPLRWWSAGELARGMEAALHTDPRFAAVRVLALTSGQLGVSAPEVLSASAKADLERAVAGAPRRTVVSYTVAPPNPP